MKTVIIIRIYIKDAGLPDDKNDDIILPLRLSGNRPNLDTKWLLISPTY